MELFKTEMVEIKSSVEAHEHAAEHVIHQEEKDRKVKRTYQIAFAAIIFTVLEDISRIFSHCYLLGKGIFVIELICVGSLMLYFTLKFTKLVGEVSERFGVSFMDEKNQLRCALGVFLSTYFLRSVIKGITVVFNKNYTNVRSNNELFIETGITFVQIIYDVLPLIIIVHQHHSAFTEQDRGPTSTTYTREYTAIKSHTTMVSVADHAKRDSN